MANLELRTKAVKQISDTLSKLLVLFSRKCEGQSRSAVVEDHSVTVITGSIQCPPVSETETKKTELVISMAKPEPFSQFAQYSMVMSRNTRSPNFLAQFRADKSSDRCHSIFPFREKKKELSSGSIAGNRMSTPHTLHLTGHQGLLQQHRHR